jgi:hypothetical protein
VTPLLGKKFTSRLRHQGTPVDSAWLGCAEPALQAGSLYSAYLHNLLTIIQLLSTYYKTTYAITFVT